MIKRDKYLEKIKTELLATEFGDMETQFVWSGDIAGETVTIKMSKI